MEIKVRAWDKKEKKMIENVGVFYSDNTAYIYKYTSPALGYVEVFVNAKYQDRFIPMLYTNCKDKNGKEIYENDIVKHPTYPEFYYKIVWYYNGFIPLGINIDNYLFCENWEELEIIGNIYENPELLKNGGKNATK